MTALSVHGLAEAAHFKATVEGVIKETDSADTSAIRMNTNLKSGDCSGKWPTATLTFIVQLGKQDGPAKKLQAAR